MNWKQIEHAPEGATVELKGFLFRTEGGAWILSSEPNLKSCCVGAGHKTSSQITLLGDFSDCSPHKPLETRGILHIQEGRYFLSDVQSTQNQSFPLWTTGVLLGCLATCLVLARIKYYSKPSSSLKR